MIKTKTACIAIAGNPNCGKTTLFNALTGGNHRVGNWPGVTVEKIEGTLKLEAEQVKIVDLPGIYSLSADSEDEKAARDFILSNEADFIINIIDSTNIERNLYLTTQILEMNVPVVLILNMTDLAEKKGIQIDAEKIETVTGLPVIAINALNSDDIKNVKSELSALLSYKNINQKAKKPVYPLEIENVLSSWNEDLKSLSENFNINTRWLGLKILEEDSWVMDILDQSPSINKLDLFNTCRNTSEALGEALDITIADYRYRFIQDLTSKAIKKLKTKRDIKEKIDNVVLNKFLGIPIFLSAMYLVFWVTMVIGGAFIDFFDIFAGTVFVDGFAALLEYISAPAWLTGFLAGGLGAGIQTVATFIPIIFFMFLMLAILEDSGYMSRAAFVMDRFMRSIGLPGKAFVPMLVGFGCTVPAIMATRTLDSKRDRFMTIFMSPFMSCGARLPVYALFGAAFFGSRSGMIVFSIYITGILLSILTGLLLKHTMFKGESSPFIMELPPYHPPRVKYILMNTWGKLKVFVMRAGKVIILVVTVLAILNTLGFDGSIGNEDSENSILSGIGKAITPVFEPIGIKKENWPATVGLFTGIFAKEAVVGTLNSLYLSKAITEEEAVEEESFNFRAGISESFVSIKDNLAGIWGGFTDPLGMGLISDNQEAVSEELETDLAVFSRMKDYFTPVSAYAYLLFILIYFPCVAALGAAIKETGKVYGTILVSYLTILAWIVSTLFYQIFEGRQTIWIITALLLLSGIIASFYLLSKNRKKIDLALYK